MSTIEDRIAVQDIMIQYASGVDERDFDRYFACFTGDVEVEGFVPETLRGVQAIRDFVVPALAAFRATQHLIALPWVRVDGDAARARTDIQASHWFAEPAGRAMILWGTYETDFVRTSDGWKISRHRLITKATRITEEA